MVEHDVTCPLAGMTFPPLLQPTKGGTQFSNSGGMQG